MSFKYLIGYNHLSILLFCSIFLSISIIKKQLYVITYPISLLYCFCLFSIILIIPFFYYVQHLFISYPIVRTYALNFFRHHIFKSSIIPLSCHLSFFLTVWVIIYVSVSHFTIDSQEITNCSTISKLTNYSKLLQYCFVS